MVKKTLFRSQGAIATDRSARIAATANIHAPHFAEAINHPVAIPASDIDRVAKCGDRSGISANSGDVLPWMKEILVHILHVAGVSFVLHLPHSPSVVKVISGTQS